MRPSEVLEAPPVGQPWKDLAELFLVWRRVPLPMALSLEQGSIGIVEQGGSDGPFSVMLVLGRLLGFQSTPLSTVPVQHTWEKKHTPRSS